MKRNEEEKKKNRKILEEFFEREKINEKLTKKNRGVETGTAPRRVTRCDPGLNEFGMKETCHLLTHSLAQS